MRELAVQSSNDTNTAEDRSEIQKEVDQLISELDRISTNTEFNTKKLLDGSFSGQIHIGANSGQAMTVSINSMGSAAIGGDISALKVDSQTLADGAIASLDDAISGVSSERSKLGAIQNRLEHTINNLSASEENLTAANSRIRDVDMAKEMMNLSKQQILSQAGTAMLAQANQMPQGVLQLLG